MTAPAAAEPTAADRRRWARYLVEERAEGHVYRRLAARRTGEEQQILLSLAEAERRHEQHWLDLLGDEPRRLPRAGARSQLLGWMAGRFGSIFVLALAQSAEARSPYDEEQYATPAMRADEKVHYEVVRGLAARGRRRLSGSFRAAVFGANDGLVSNLALVLGIGATGVSSSFVLFSGVAGLLAGALSMGAGEFVSVRSQRELLAATEANDDAADSAGDLDIDENELALVYRARGIGQDEALARARRIVQAAQEGVRRTATGPVRVHPGDDTDIVGSDWTAAISSFLLFSSGAIIPVLPWIFGLQGATAVIVALVLVGIALLSTGAMVGILSGGPPLRRALRQLAIGFGAAAITYLLGLLFGVGAV
ncbi:rubrerythrin family protein [Microbacterium sp. ANT_H45B]|uniref:VIT1/CCC1 transporter family protein n=1 Tax=Microbacterium TaxID=33882 RepID=UPI0011EEB3EA|nr:MULTISPECIES: VIT1/CCC1 family protein [Microbacterium]KAA0961034.1 rubrerythrin family protein [Microbacterium sp. ANT_H45B]MCP1429879.1 VIT1/CCC1 family predicted Fe2+/Mn2+ transporter [Microbacterium foliorum]